MAGGIGSLKSHARDGRGAQHACSAAARVSPPWGTRVRWPGIGAPAADSADDVDSQEWRVFICHRNLRDLSGKLYQRLPAGVKDRLRAAGLCHYMVVVQRGDGRLIQFDFGPKGKDVQWFGEAQQTQQQQQQQQQQGWSGASAQEQQRGVSSSAAPSSACASGACGGAAESFRTQPCGRSAERALAFLQWCLPQQQAQPAPRSRSFDASPRLRSGGELPLHSLPFARTGGSPPGMLVGVAGRMAQRSAGGFSGSRGEALGEGLLPRHAALASGAKGEAAPAKESRFVASASGGARQWGAEGWEQAAAALEEQPQWRWAALPAVVSGARKGTGWEGVEAQHGGGRGPLEGEVAPQPNGEVREEELRSLPASALFLGHARLSLRQMREFNALQDQQYQLCRNDCRHYADAFVLHTTGIDRASARLSFSSLLSHFLSSPWDPSNLPLLALRLCLDKDAVPLASSRGLPAVALAALSASALRRAPLPSLSASFAAPSAALTRMLLPQLQQPPGTLLRLPRTPVLSSFSSLSLVPSLVPASLWAALPPLHSPPHAPVAVGRALLLSAVGALGTVAGRHAGLPAVPCPGR